MSKRARSTSVTLSSPTTLLSSDMHHRPHQPTLRTTPSYTSVSSATSTPKTSPRSSPLPSFTYLPPEKSAGQNWSAPSNGTSTAHARESTPTIFGMPLKYVSLVTLAVQNAALSIVMHYSRVSTTPAKSYSPASAVLFNELLKGFISFVIAYARVQRTCETSNRRPLTSPAHWTTPLRILWNEVFSADCWKLSIPALLYVIQNSLQFVAVSNLPVASFQVIYQMKILTTAAFSVALLGKRLSPVKWLSLLFLALGVGIVQVQTTTGHTTSKSMPVGSAHDSAPLHIHVMSPLKGFAAVIIACFTSGLAGVYFERELKNSKADLWVRNIQLTLFSLIPAIMPILYAPAPPDSYGFVRDLFRNFGGWAWATVFIQVFGGLITALVIKYSDNILKGFATSLSIILSSLASVFLFDFNITLPFVIGSSTVLAATWMYNQPADKEPRLAIVVNAAPSLSRKLSNNPTFPGSPITSKDPIIGQPTRKTSPFPSPRILANALGLSSSASASPISTDTNLLGNGHRSLSGRGEQFSDMLSTERYMQAPYGSPFSSRPPSRAPSPAPPSARPSPSPRHSDLGRE